MPAEPLSTGEHLTVLHGPRLAGSALLTALAERGVISRVVESPDELVALVQMDRVSALAPLFDRIFKADGDSPTEHPFLARLAERHAPETSDDVPEPAVVTLRDDDEGLSLLYRIHTAAFPALAADSAA